MFNNRQSENESPKEMSKMPYLPKQIEEESLKNQISNKSQDTNTEFNGNNQSAAIGFFRKRSKFT